MVFSQVKVDHKYASIFSRLCVPKGIRPLEKQNFNNTRKGRYTITSHTHVYLKFISFFYYFPYKYLIVFIVKYCPTLYLY